jgi:hypothetical protein
MIYEFLKKWLRPLTSLTMSIHDSCISKGLNHLVILSLLRSIFVAWHCYDANPDPTFHFDTYLDPDSLSKSLFFCFYKANFH